MTTLAELQKRNLERMGTPPEDTESRKSASTDLRDEGSAGAREAGAKEARKPASKRARTDGGKEGSPSAATPVTAEAVFFESVERALSSREPITGGVKATVDMSPDLNARARRYLADHRGRSVRQILIALLDAFLTMRGY